MREVVQEAKTLDEAFEILRRLDPPMDRTQAMVSLCRQDWSPGVFIDDYFYELWSFAVEAQAPQKMVCTLLKAQLPTPVQGPIKEWLATTEEIESIQARKLFNWCDKPLAKGASYWTRGIVIFHVYVANAVQGK